MNRKLCRNRKGVSTVIATILMIMIVMIGMSILFGSLIVYSENFQKGRGSSVLESITVEDVYFMGPDNVQLSIFNTGKVDLKITNVYINGQMATLTPPTPLTIKVGEHKELSVIPSGVTFIRNTGYSFKIVTERGTGFEGTYIW
jgi:hypothetical protein